MCKQVCWLHSQVKLPLEVGTFMECEWKEGQYHRAKIIERRKRPDTQDYEYYVHYIGCKLIALCMQLIALCLQPAFLFPYALVTRHTLSLHYDGNPALHIHCCKYEGMYEHVQSVIEDAVLVLHLLPSPCAQAELGCCWGSIV